MRLAVWHTQTMHTNFCVTVSLCSKVPIAFPAVLWYTDSNQISERRRYKYGTNCKLFCGSRSLNARHLCVPHRWDVTTYDLRTRTPNAGDYMDNLTMHSVEHMFATYIRNSEIADQVIYFGPMGCQTGFYLLTRGLNNEVVLAAVLDTLQRIVDHDGEMFGAQRKECGNYQNLSLEAAKIEAKRYMTILQEKDNDFLYR